MKDKYNEEQIDYIMGMLSYMVNAYNGLGRFNDETLYKENLKTKENQMLQVCNARKLALRFRKELLICAVKLKSKK